MCQKVVNEKKCAIFASMNNMLRKHLLVLVAMLLLSLSVSAQFAMGVRAGYANVLHSERTTDIDGAAFTLHGDNSHGLTVGLMMRAGMKVLVQIEGYYQYNKATYFNSDTTMWFNESYSTIELPIMLGYKVVDREKVNWRFMIGPRFRFSAGASSNIDSLYTNVCNKWQLGLSAGTGFDFGPVTLDFRYNLTSNIFATEYLATPEPIEIQRAVLHGFDATIGFKFVDIRRRQGGREKKKG